MHGLARDNCIIDFDSVCIHTNLCSFFIDLLFIFFFCNGLDKMRDKICILSSINCQFSLHKAKENVDLFS